MSEAVLLHFESRLAAPVSAVLRHALTMEGVNDELTPLLRMTYPAAFRHSHLEPRSVGRVLFYSWVLLFRFVPIDRHAMRFDTVLAQGFDQHSESWLHRDWMHRRRVNSVGAGAVVVDEVRFVARWPWLRPLLRALVRHVFEHRHQRLRARYGIAPSG